MALNAKQQMFVEIYLQCWNGSEAARQAGYSKKTDYSIASGLLRKHEIKEAIRNRLSEKAMEANEVLARISDMARGSFFDFIRVTKEGAVEFDFGNPEAKKHLHLIKSIHTKRKRLVALGTGTKNKAPDEWEHEWVEVELYDAQHALDTLAKHHKLVSDQVEATVTFNLDGYEVMMEKVYGKRKGG